MTEPTLSDALDLLPEAWHDDVADDAAAQGCAVGYTSAAGGLRTKTIERMQRLFTEREADGDWQAMSPGHRLDECFPSYCGIGSFELLAELGVTPVYVLPAD
ncbi:hypothetical protein nbrc107696_28490 [Gordonia spumicola]|uniref:Uncharacterized protein n=1 Tax=Gordonia spumicola TaxID=589161 RepID=A0A7I9VBB8_9ACTN|nr:hypothetical protein [Gordonia spumicola]GEE02403.1 hypothetical protein nbrc107696_28490 [Gordonia spumicola]